MWQTRAIVFAIYNYPGARKDVMPQQPAAPGGKS